MTLHVTTFTPSHVVSVCDRLLSVQGKCVELADDRYKHFVLICDNARVAVSFCGIAGSVDRNNRLVDDTLDWLTNVASATAHSRHDIDSHLNDFRDQLQPRINYLKSKYHLASEKLKLAVQVCGLVRETPFNCVIHNYLNRKCDAVQRRPSFTTHHKTYDAASFQHGCCIFLLGQRVLAIAEKTLCNQLDAVALKGDPRQIFEASVAVIRAAARRSRGTIGNNCSGLRITRGDAGIEVFDDRLGTIWDTVMPNVVKSTSGMSFEVRNMRGSNT